MTRDLPASVRGRLENLARETSRPLQELMQYFVIERFLFRLSKSKYADRFVLKGALMFTFWGTLQSRATRDIDLLARADNSVETMLRIITEVCQHPVEPDGVEFISDSIQGAIIKEDAEYSGVRVTFVAKIQNARLPMQLDIGFGDVIYPAAISMVYPTMLDFESPRLVGYPKETVIAEKFEAMVKLGQLNSRMKDLFDIHLLARQFKFDAAVLIHAIQKTFPIAAPRSWPNHSCFHLRSWRTRPSRLSGPHSFASPKSLARLHHLQLLLMIFAIFLNH